MAGEKLAQALVPEMHTEVCTEKYHFGRNDFGGLISERRASFAAGQDEQKHVAAFIEKRKPVQKGN